MYQDSDALRVLAIFHFVVAGMAVLVSLFPAVHLFVGICLVSGAFTDPGDPFVLALVGWLFIILASCWILGGLIFASCLAVAGRMLVKRRGYLFCMVMAGLACMFMPFGTVLGVFTILTLTKASVRALFQSPALESSG